MRKIELLTSFKKDYEKVKKQQWNLKAIDELILNLAQMDILPAKLKDHALKGNYIGFRECHISLICC